MAKSIEIECRLKTGGKRTQCSGCHRDLRHEHYLLRRYRTGDYSYVTERLCLVCNHDAIIALLFASGECSAGEKRVV